MRALFFASAVSALSLQVAQAQGILPELMYGVYALDESCSVEARRMIITPTDILMANPGLDLRIHYPDQTQITGDQIALNGNFFVSVIYDGVIQRTGDGALMSFNFPDLSFPLLEPILASVFSGDVPTSVKADLNLQDAGETVIMTLAADDPALGERLAGAIGTWTFDAAQITRTRAGVEAVSVYPRCYDGKTADVQHGDTIAGKTGVYARDGQCSPGNEAFIIANDGWGLAIPFADPTIGFASSVNGQTINGELYRAPFAPLAPNENSYMDLGVRDGALSHSLTFNGNSFTWMQNMGEAGSEEAGTFTQCSSVDQASFAEIAATIDTYLTN